MIIVQIYYYHTYKGTLPVFISLDSAIFKPGVHSIIIVANSTAGDVATFSNNFTVVGNNH